MVRPSCIARIKNDIKAFATSQPPGIALVPDEEDITKLHALIVGPHGTPYEGGLFYFILRCPEDYPFKPPRVTLMTTGGGRVTFNPNLYHCGKVCLSILGTWEGPQWSPAMHFSHVLISIQSILNDKPFHNEPGFSHETQFINEANDYNEMIRHETLRVAVVAMMAHPPKNFPADLQNAMVVSFMTNYDRYVSTCTKHKHLNGRRWEDKLSAMVGTFDYNKILTELRQLEKTLSP